MTKILVVEDEVIIAADLKMILEKRGYHCDHTDHAEKAMMLMNKYSYQLVLLDIFISGDVDGVELADQIRSQFEIPLIFLTSYYDNQTLERVKAIKPEAYIVKPFEERNLIANVELALYRFNQTKVAALPVEKLFVKDQAELIALESTNILYIEADDNYARVVSGNKTYTLSHPIKKVEGNLSDLPFIRVHRSYIINLMKVTSIQEGFIFLGEVKVPLGRKYKQDFMNALTVL